MDVPADDEASIAQQRLGFRFAVTFDSAGRDGEWPSYQVRWPGGALCFFIVNAGTYRVWLCMAHVEGLLGTFASDAIVVATEDVATLLRHAIHQPALEDIFRLPRRHPMCR